MNCEVCEMLKFSICLKCEIEKKWKRLKIKDRVKIQAYRQLIITGKFNAEIEDHSFLGKYILDNNLSVSMIPVE